MKTKFKFKSGDSLITVEAVSLWSARNLLAHLLRGADPAPLTQFNEVAQKATLLNADKLFLGMPEEVFVLFDRACNRAYGTVQEDLGPKSISRRDAIEITLDADRVRMYGSEHGHDARKKWEPYYDAHIAPWIRQHYGTPQFWKTMALIFTDSRYNW